MGMIPVWESEGGHWFHLGRGRIVKLYYPGRPTDGIGAICIAVSIPEGLQLSLLGMSGLLERTELQRLAQLVEAALDELASTGAVKDGPTFSHTGIRLRNTEPVQAHCTTARTASYP